MRYPASEKLEIIRIVEQSHLPVRRTLDKLGILPGSFYRWYDRYRTGGVEALDDKPSEPARAWSRIPMPPLRRTRLSDDRTGATLRDIQLRTHVLDARALPSCVGIRRSMRPVHLLRLRRRVCGRRRIGYCSARAPSQKITVTTVSLVAPDCLARRIERAFS